MSTHEKRWDGLTISDSLSVGVYFAGTRHKSFTLRVPMAGDLIAAQERHPNGPLQLVTLEVYRQQLLSLGDIPSESLTTELLRAELAEADLALLAEADAELEKKLAPPSAASPTGAASSTPSSDSATE
ncbi:phage tail assembly protein [Pseudomonas sp. PS02288]|uniref:phage tail assembly protein n=1 Tax=Pseudomonas sp. PS02288 TaxID=2991443 RepID=UPI00249AB9B5|nr:phage tail assembly protein [Pseudomonas sp. PS02288]